MNAHYTTEGYDVNGEPTTNPLIFKPLHVYGNGKRGECFFPIRKKLKKK